MIASVAAVLFAAAITPGPNNLVVMASANHSLRAAFAPILGVVLGTLILVFVLRLGLGAAMVAHPDIEELLRLAGAGLLAYIALRALATGWADPAGGHAAPESRGLFLAMLVLQVVNPKTWVLATAVSTTHAAEADGSLLTLALLTLAVPSACLLIWAVAGRGMGPFLQRPTVKKSFAAVMALALAGFAAAILLGP